MTTTTVLRSLRRTTASGRFLPEIDGLRFVSIMSVVLFHIVKQITTKRGLTSTGLFWDALQVGNFGVEIFFCISGFILALPFAEWRINNGKAVVLRRYYLRRVTRIEPPYMINILLLFALLPVVGSRFATDYHSQWPHLWASLGYVHGLIFNDLSTLNSVTWSLEIEVQFYILAPLLCRLFLLQKVLLRRTILLAGILVFAAAAHAGVAEAARWRFTLVPYLQYFFSGFMVADLYCASWNRAPGHSPKWDYVGFLSAAALVAALIPPMNGSTPAAAASISLPFILIAFMASALRSRFFRSLLISLPVTVIGGMCYTIYLYHFPIIAAVTRVMYKFLPPIGFWPLFWVTAFACIPAVVIVSALLFAYIEKPFMNVGIRKRATAVQAKVA